MTTDKATNETARTDPKADVKTDGKADAKGENIRDRRRRQRALDQHRCIYCGQTGLCEVTSSPKPAEGEPRILQVRCRACTRPQQVTVAQA